MKSLALIAAFAMVILPAAARPADETASREKLFKELREIEMALERVRRLVPPGFDLVAERNAIDSLARKAELSPVDVKVVLGTERLSLDDGQPVPIVIDRLEIAGRDAYDAVHFFLSMLRRRPRLVGVESLRFDAGPGESVRFVARLMYPSWATLPADDERSSDMDAALRRRLARNRAIRDRIVAAIARMQDGSAMDALGVFTKAAHEHAIALTSVRIDDGISMEGLLLGAAARAALSASLDNANLRVSRMEWSHAGVCQAFSVRARSEPAEDSGGFTPSRPVFDGDSAAFCRGEAESPARRILARGAASTDDNAFSLRLRNLDLVDVFFLLNDLIAENFVIDQDVKGRIDLDVLEGATVHDALSAVSSAGVVIGPRPLRRVSRGKPSVSSAQRPSSGGEPISISMRDVDLASILCLLAGVSGHEIRMPREQQRRVSLFATELPAGDALDQLVPPSSTTAVNACELSGDSGSRLSKQHLKLEQLGVADLRIAGLARVGDTWRAYVYAPTRRVIPLEPGQRLFDGSVKSIGPKGVTFTSDGKGVAAVPFVP
jgi:hypothetical protein